MPVWNKGRTQQRKPPRWERGIARSGEGGLGNVERRHKGVQARKHETAKEGNEMVTN